MCIPHLLKYSLNSSVSIVPLLSLFKSVKLFFIVVHYSLILLKMAFIVSDYGIIYFAIFSENFPTLSAYHI